MKILICTDGSTSSLQSAELLSFLRFPASTNIIVLGVRETDDDEKKITASMTEIEKRLGNKYSVNKKIRSGIAINEILSEAVDGAYDLVALGGGEKQLGLLQPHIGSTTSNLTHKLHTHFLIARNISKKLENILFCVGADALPSDTLRLGGKWISKTTAQIGLLHVVPLSLKGMDTTGDDKSIAISLLEQSSQQLRDAGIKEQVVTHIRRGIVVDEVLTELSHGGYDLLVVGSHYQKGQDRWQGTLLDDVTDQLLKYSTCSVLII